MARPSNTDERRAQIARALLKVMARHGYDGASIGAIARAARVAQGLVHYHFKDKREILLVAIAELGARHQARLRGRLAEAGAAPVARLEALLGAHLGLGAADPEALACWVSMSGEALRDAKVRAAVGAVLSADLEEIRAVVRDGVAAGVFRCDDEAAAAAAIGAVIQGYFVLAGAAREVIPPGSALRSAQAMAWGLLGASGSRREAPDGEAPPRPRGRRAAPRRGAGKGAKP